MNISNINFIFELKLLENSVQLLAPYPFFMQFQTLQEAHFLFHFFAISFFYYEISDRGEKLLLNIFSNHFLFSFALINFCAKNIDLTVAFRKSDIYKLNLTILSVLPFRIFHSPKSTLSSNKPQIYFNGTVQLNISISSDYFLYQNILPLPNGDLVRGSGGNLIEIWDLQNGIIKRNLTSVYTGPFVFGLLSNGDLVAGYYFSETLLVWDLKITNGESLKRIMQTNDIFRCITVLKNDDLAIGQRGNGYDIIIRDSQNGLIKKKLVGHTWYVYQIIELPNGNLVSCSSDFTVKVWNISNGAVIKSITHETFVYSIAFLSNGYLVSGLHNGRINIWNLETNQLIRNLIGHTSHICNNNCLHVLANGDLLSGSWDKTIKVWNPSDGTVKFTSPLHKSKVIKLAVLPSGNFISLSRISIGQFLKY
ncbi:WD-40 repeat [Brachionus plicatilis]|uniref:WD-40 repeat n=1 Tax=Brachionus plicatilis TaxID=10195 RepID=A0A3M7PUK6_BRAPC|nr:WD-40 repeat [Brachionus plicatilis]